MFVARNRAAGSRVQFRAPQTNEFFDSIRDCNDRIPILIAAGDRDIGPDKGHDEDWSGFEKQTMESYFYFEFGARYWIVVDSNVYQLNNTQAVKHRDAQDAW